MRLRCLRLWHACSGPMLIPMSDVMCVACRSASAAEMEAVRGRSMFLVRCDGIKGWCRWTFFVSQCEIFSAASEGIRPRNNANL